MINDNDKWGLLKDGLKRAVLFKNPYCKISEGQILALNDFYSFGWKIEDNFDAFPHTKSLNTIVSKISPEYSATFLDDGTMSIVSDKFRGVVQCSEDEFDESVKHDALLYPDAPAIKADASILDALKCVIQAATMLPETPVSHCVFIGASSVLALDGVTFLEHTHSLAFPGICSLPAEAVKMLLRLKLEPIAIGGTETTLTFHFENGWFKTVLTSTGFSEKGYSYFSLARDACVFSKDLTQPLIKTIDTIAITSKSNEVVFTKDGIYSSSDFQKACSYEAEFDNKPYSFNGKKLKVLKLTHDAKFGFGELESTNLNKIPILYFEQKDFRGVIAGLEIVNEPKDLGDIDEEVSF